MDKTRLIKIPPFHYLHVLNKNSNITTLVKGPKTYICKDNEQVTFGPAPMIVIPPRHYCIINNPVLRKSDGKSEENESGLIMEEFGFQPKLRYGDQEIRFESFEPFPLYPGEELKGKITPLRVVEANTALKLSAIRDFVDTSGEKTIRRKAGETWIFFGPATYYPQIEVTVDETIQATIVKPNQALRVQALKGFKDRFEKNRQAGEEWLVYETGAFLPEVGNERIIGTVEGIVLTEKIGLQLKASHNFRDISGIFRKAGDRWLVTSKDRELHIPDVFETVEQIINLITVPKNHWCVIGNPMENGISKIGESKLIKGESSFFLQPGEFLERAVQSNIVLGEEDGLWVSCFHECQEEYYVRGQRKTSKHQAGERWMVYGPCEYVPPLPVIVLQRKKALLQVESLNFYALYL